MNTVSKDYKHAEDEGDYINKGGTHKIMRYLLLNNPCEYSIKDILCGNPVITPLFVSNNLEIIKYYLKFETLLQNPHFVSTFEDIKKIAFNKIHHRSVISQIFELHITDYEGTYDTIYEGCFDKYNIKKIEPKVGRFTYDQYVNLNDRWDKKLTNHLIAKQIHDFMYAAPLLNYRNPSFTWNLINEVISFLDEHYDTFDNPGYPYDNCKIFRKNTMYNAYLEHHNETLNKSIMEIYPDFVKTYLPTYDHKITYDIIKQHNKYNWSYKYLSNYRGITFMDVINHPEHDWDHDLLSQNSNITLDMVRAYPDIKWNYVCLSANSNITYDMIMEGINIFNMPFEKDWLKIYYNNPNNSFDLLMETYPDHVYQHNIFLNVYTFNKVVYKNKLIKYINKSNFILKQLNKFINLFVR